MKRALGTERSISQSIPPAEFRDRGTPDEAARPAMGQALRIRADPSGFDSELLTTAFECGPQGIALAENRRVVHGNAAFAALYAYSDPSDLAGRLLQDLRPQDSFCVPVSAASSALNPGVPSCWEYLAHRKNGTFIRLESRCASFRYHERTFLIVSVREASERLPVVRDNDHRFRTFLDASAIGILQLDLEGKIVEANPAFQKMLGYSAEELRGVPLRTLAPGEDFKFFELGEGRRDAYEAGGEYHGNDGRARWFHLSTSLVRGPDGEPEAAIGVVEDITERKNAERRLRQRAYEVRQATNGSAAAEVASNHKGSIDLPLADIATPGMGGRELGKRLRGARPGMKIVYISGFDPKNSSDTRGPKDRL